MAYIAYFFHFVFRTKRSLRVIEPQNATRLYNYIVGVAKGLGCNVLKINGMTDHIHIAVELNPTIAPSVFMREVKSRSSYWINDNKSLFPYFEGWGKSYFGSTFSAKDRQRVEAYISNQQEHHKSKSFENEITDFFKYADMPGKCNYFLAD